VSLSERKLQQPLHNRADTQCSNLATAGFLRRSHVADGSTCFPRLNGVSRFWDHVPNLRATLSDGARPIGAAGAVVDAATEPASALYRNIAGQIKVDNSSCSSHGNLYQTFVALTSVDISNKRSYECRLRGRGHRRSSPIPRYRSLTTNFSCGAGSTCRFWGGLGNLFPGLAVDNFGYVYATWSDNTGRYYSFSNNHGTAGSGHQGDPEHVPGRKVERIPLDLG